MGIGRGMGFAIMQRDDDASDPVKLREVSPYYSEHVNTLLKEANTLARMTLADAADAAGAEFYEREQQYREAREQQQALQRRYLGMIAKVEAWDPGDSESARGVKRFALEQLRESYTFDCPDSRDPWPGKPFSGDYEPETWLAAKRAENSRLLGYARRSLCEELERVRDFNEAILAFYEALPAEALDSVRPKE